MDLCWGAWVAHPPADSAAQVSYATEVLLFLVGHGCRVTAGSQPVPLLDRVAAPAAGVIRCLNPVTAGWTVLVAGVGVEPTTFGL